MKTSDAAFRLWRRRWSIAPIWTSASGVVRTGRLTAAGAGRRESPMLEKAGPLPRTPRTRREPGAERGARRLSESSLSSSATKSMVVPSGRVVGSSRTSRPVLDACSKRAHTATVPFAWTPPASAPAAAALRRTGGARDENTVPDLSFRSVLRITANPQVWFEPGSSCCSSSECADREACLHSAGVVYAVAFDVNQLRP